jgi:uncharacterized RDD family membrane protein YckC
MNVWLLIDDKKNGPHHDFEIRSMINNKELRPEVMAWHEGMEKWKPLDEIPLFQDSFDSELNENEGDDDIHQANEKFKIVDRSNVKAYLEQLTLEENQNGPKRTYTAEGELVLTLQDGELGVYLWRRIFARVADLILLICLTFIYILLFKRQDPTIILETERGMLLWMLLIVTYDTFMLHIAGTTIGKAILGIRIESLTGQNLSLLQSFIRGLVVTVSIVAAGHPIVLIIIITLCIVFAKLRQRLPWDIYATSASRALKFSVGRAIATVLMIISLLIMVGMFTPKHIAEQQEKRANELLEQLGK